MPVLYKTIQSTMKTKDGDKLYHPRTVYVGSVNTEKIAQEIAEYSSLSKGDVKNSIDNLVTVMTRHLQSSEVVMLDGLGTFRLAMKSRGKGCRGLELRGNQDRLFPAKHIISGNAEEITQHY